MPPEPVFLRPALIAFLAAAALVLWGVVGALTLASALNATGATLGIGVAIILSFGATALGCLWWLRRDNRTNQERILANQERVISTLAATQDQVRAALSQTVDNAIEKVFTIGYEAGRRDAPPVV